MSQSTNLPEHKLRQQARPTLVSTADADLHRRPKANVLSHVLECAELHHPFATELSASWLVHHLHHSPDRRPFAEHEARLWSALHAQDETMAATKEKQP
jgi:hypothetical protein